MAIKKVTINADANTTSPQDNELKFLSDSYRAQGIAYCETCGEKLRTKADGSTLCPIAKKDCDRNV